MENKITKGEKLENIFKNILAELEPIILYCITKRKPIAVKMTDLSSLTILFGTHIKINFQKILNEI